MRKPQPSRGASSTRAGDPPSPRRYRVEVLVAPELGDEGIDHGREGRCLRLRWGEIEFAVAAEIGEPQGVRTIVFDLVREQDGEWVAGRLDAEPGEQAAGTARAIDAALGDAARPSIKSLATDGIPSRWYPDLESFEEAIIAELG